jgi:muconolactone delta-isomerase
MEYLVEFTVRIPAGTGSTEVQERDHAEAAAAADLIRRGHLDRLWSVAGPPGASRAVGIYRAAGDDDLQTLLHALPLDDWMDTAVTPLARHPNDIAGAFEFSVPQLRPVYRLQATLGQPLELGETGGWRRRVVPLTGGTVTGPEINGQLLPGPSADWQTIRADGTVFGDIRYTLQTDEGELLDVRSRSVRHGSPEVLERLSRGEDVNPSEYVFRTTTEITTAAPALDWLNTGVFVAVGGRQATGVSYETYLVG